MTAPYTVILTTGEPETGLWCGACLLPSRIRVPVILITETGASDTAVPPDRRVHPLRATLLTAAPTIGLMHKRGAKPGTPTGTVITTPARRRRDRQARQRQEQRWAGKAGPVTITRAPRDDTGEPQASLET